MKCLPEDELGRSVGHHHSVYSLSGYDACDPATNSTPPSFPLTSEMSEGGSVTTSAAAAAATAIFVFILPPG